MCGVGADCDALCPKVGKQREAHFGSCLPRVEPTVAWHYCHGLMGKQGSQWGGLGEHPAPLMVSRKLVGRDKVLF